MAAAERKSQWTMDPKHPPPPPPPPPPPHKYDNFGENWPRYNGTALYYMYRLVTCSAHGEHVRYMLNQCWVIVSWALCNRLSWIVNKNEIEQVSFKKVHLKMSSAKYWPFCSDLRMFKLPHLGRCVVVFVRDTCMYQANSYYSKHEDTGMILGLRPANERRRYIVTSLIGWAQA